MIPNKCCLLFGLLETTVAFRKFLLEKHNWIKPNSDVVKLPAINRILYYREQDSKKDRSLTGWSSRCGTHCRAATTSKRELNILLLLDWGLKTENLKWNSWEILKSAFLQRWNALFGDVWIFCISNRLAWWVSASFFTSIARFRAETLLCLFFGTDLIVRSLSTFRVGPLYSEKWRRFWDFWIFCLSIFFVIGDVVLGFSKESTISKICSCLATVSVLWHATLLIKNL